MRVKNENIIDDSGPIVLDQNRQTQALWLGHAMMYSIQIEVSGTPTGSLKLQISNDLGQANAASADQQDEGVVTWTDLPSSTQAVSAAGTFFWTVADAAHPWVRLVYTHSSGSGSIIKARLYSKGV